MASRPFASRLCFERPLNIILIVLTPCDTLYHFAPLYDFLWHTPPFVKEKMDEKDVLGGFEGREISVGFPFKELYEFSGARAVSECRTFLLAFSSQLGGHGRRIKKRQETKDGPIICFSKSGDIFSPLNAPGKNHLHP